MTLSCTLKALLQVFLGTKRVKEHASFKEADDNGLARLIISEVSIEERPSHDALQVGSLLQQCNCDGSLESRLGVRLTIRWLNVRNTVE